MPKLIPILFFYVCTFSAVSFGAPLFLDNFNNQSLSNWGGDFKNYNAVSVDPIGGMNGTAGVRFDYTVAGTARYDFVTDLSTFNLSDFYIYVDFKVNVGTNMSNIKFVKIRGSIGSDGGYANSTFSLLLNGTVQTVGYGDGTGIQNDTQNSIQFITNGDQYSDFDSNVVVPIHNGPVSVADGNWHSYEIHMRYNTDGNRDGLYEVWVDGIQRLRATNVRNRNNANIRQAQTLLIGNYAATLSNFTLRYDNITVSRERIGGNPVLPNPKPSAPQNLIVR